MTSPRVISLIASATETVAALGGESQLVGRSHECDYPAAVQQLPMCSQPRIDIEGTSLQIDERVRSALREALSIYRVLPERLQELRPDVIITQTQCEVCAVSLADVEEAVCALVDSHPQIVALEPNCLADIWRDILRVADAIGRKDAGAALVASLQSRLAAIREQAGRLPQPTVAGIEWIEPIMTGGNWMPEIIEIAGGKNLFGEAGKHSPYLEWSAIVAADPDVIVVHPCGWGLAKCREEMRALTSRPEWSSLRAVRERRVCLTDGNQYFNRPGPRVVESTEILAEILHPAHFNFGHAGQAWEPL